jgi:RNA polymerase sigma-70 factor (ECF subfamily)
MRANHARSAGSSSDNAGSPHSGGAFSQGSPPTSPVPDAALIAAAQAGDPEALRQLLAAARPRLVALALRVLGDPDEAEDAVQEAMVKVWRNLGRFEGRAAFGTWLHRIAVNAALDRIRRRATGARPQAHVDDHDDRPARDEGVVEETPEQTYARAETGAVVRRALGRLTAVHGEAIRLCDLDGESYATIATATACPVGTVMSRIYHARRKLVRELTETAKSELDLAALCAA